jgi:ligand-binding SRPBCC domain-containing protein
MVVRVSTELEIPAERAWETVKKVDTLRYITRGVLGFRPLGEVPETIAEGEVIRVRLMFFHVLPAWKHEIEIVGVDEQARRIETMEHGGSVKRWNHVITVEPAGDGRSLYTDRIDLEAGRMTPLVAGYAKVFYRYRQRRWRKLARQLASGST